MDKDKQAYEIFGLFEDQIKDLSERFGDAVIEKNVEEENIVIRLSVTDASNMSMDGYSMTPRRDFK